jgi:MFS family permease
MSALVRKGRGTLLFTGIGKLATVSFIASLAISFVNTIWAIYIDSFVNSVVLVGFITMIFVLTGFVSRFLFIPLIEKSSKSKLFSYALLVSVLIYILMAINDNFLFFILLGVIVTIFGTLRITAFGIMVRDKSAKKQLSRNEGIMYTFMNMSWVIGPLIAGYVAEQMGMNKVFILSAIFLFLAFVFFKKSRISDFNVKKRVDKKVLKNFRDFFKNRERTLSYIISGGVNLWWVLIYLFIPLLIIRSGLSKMWVGYFLFAVPIPLILLEYVFAKLAGKIGFKKIFKIGFLIPCILAFICFFVGNIYIVLFLLALASVGMALLEPTTEAYFFDVLKDKEELRFYGPYNTTISVNNLIGRFIPSLFLIFLPFKFIFLIFSAFMFIMFLVSFKVKNILECKRGVCRKKNFINRKSLVKKNKKR